MKALSIKGVDDKMYAEWRRSAFDSATSFRDWVIEALNSRAINKPGTDRLPMLASAEKSHAFAVDKPRELTAEERKLLIEAKERQRKVSPIAPEMKKSTDRTLTAFREKYNREPNSSAELEGFGKRGW